MLMGQMTLSSRTPQLKGISIREALASNILSKRRECMLREADREEESTTKRIC
jgi:hypothetical protein